MTNDFLSFLSAEVIVGDVALWNAKIVEHFKDGGIHHWWSAQIILDIFGCWMLLEIVVKNHLMDEPDVALPIVFGLWLRQSNVEFEVRKIFLDSSEMIDIEQFPDAATTVPIGNFAVCLSIAEKFKDMATQRSHSSTATNVDHFVVSVLDKELTIRTRDRDLITGLEIEDVGTDFAWRSSLWCARRRRRYAHVEHDNPLFTRVVGHRIGSKDWLFND